VCLAHPAYGGASVIDEAADLDMIVEVDDLGLFMLAFRIAEAVEIESKHGVTEFVEQLCEWHIQSARADAHLDAGR
jgi:hypothetical protein